MNAEGMVDGHRPFPLPRSDIAVAVRPGWRELPQAGTPAAAGYLNMMKPATPNVLLTLTAPARVRLPGGLSRSVCRLGLHLDEPELFLAALAKPTRAAPSALVDLPAR